MGPHESILDRLDRDFEELALGSYYQNHPKNSWINRLSSPAIGMLMEDIVDIWRQDHGCT